MKKDFKRPFVLSYFTKHGSTVGAPVLTAMRYYARLTTCVPQAVKHLLEQGQPGDVVEIASSNFGYQVGFARVKAGGRIDIQWNNDLIKGM